MLQGTGIEQDLVRSWNNDDRHGWQIEFKGTQNKKVGKKKGVVNRLISFFASHHVENEKCPLVHNTVDVKS